MTTEPIVVGIMYPPQLPEGAAERICAIDPRIELHMLPYMEPHDLRVLRAAGPVSAEAEATAPEFPEEHQDVLARAHVLMLLDLPPRLRDRADKLEWAQAIGAGIGQLDAPALAEKGVTLTNGAGVASVPIAEFAFGRLIEVWKEIRILERAQRDHRWEFHQGLLVKGRTLGIVGLGAIGRAVAKRARGFEMEVLATRRSARPGDTDPDVDELLPAAQLDDMLARCDAVVASAPETPETKDLFDAGRFAVMKPGAIFCNVGRGSAVVEQALIDALESGHLSAAVLDVFREEPLPADHPFWDMEQVYISPHSSTAREGYNEALVDLLEENLRRYLAGEPLKNLVDPDANY